MRRSRPWTNLSAIYELVTLYGLEERVGIDLAMTKDIDYYSGLLIEGYTPELGFTLGSGGQYDTLVAGSARTSRRRASPSGWSGRCWCWTAWA